MDAVAVLQTVLTAIQSGSVSINGTQAITANATAHVPAAVPITPMSLLQLPTLIAHLLSLSAVRDWIKLLLIGAALESCRRFLTSSWTTIKNYFWITVTLDESDDCGCEFNTVLPTLSARGDRANLRKSHVDWLMFWLSRHHVFRELRISSRT